MLTFIFAIIFVIAILMTLFIAFITPLMFLGAAIWSIVSAFKDDILLGCIVLISLISAVLSYFYLVDSVFFSFLCFWWVLSLQGLLLHALKIKISN
ncbi:hypothetical protein CEP48_05180 [Mergibacter septicus]|uniref:Uncharacterized protein n=1 Tax=Mergibacter septicus TaxID=221402 RepID=A0A8D4IWX1_9PAST|nr:hypothetical protein [Mergibacter septicus]AWX13624.1 hypothetical protein CEP49_03170 [Mergibacter septicus]AWX15602.1 hypothetical protein CEP47_05180 [Mergibacter septicus]QDJ13080.1 hypothetical protein CEP45_04090 [Mergibacter septicus]QDJ14856.1 hypothetical protein CEP48_05180 [Mergibacter septicus]UTU47716.1 hypothetical protein HLL31_02405 [Mergibacter septicus]